MIKVHKVDDQGKALANAEFTLTDDKGVKVVQKRTEMAWQHLILLPTKRTKSKKHKTLMVIQGNGLKKASPLLTMDKPLNIQ